MRRPLRVGSAIEGRFARGYSNRPLPPSDRDNTPRLILVLDGALSYTVSGQSFKLGAGRALYLGAPLPRSWTVATPRARVAWCRFDAGVAFEGAEWSVGAIDPRVESEATRRISLALAVRDGARQLAAEFEVKAMLARFVVRLRTGSHGAAGRRLHGDEAVERGVEWLQQHYAKRRAIEGIADRVGLSPAYFRRRFRAMTGRSPQAFLLDLRMARAQYHLQRSGLLVKQVAAAVGYDDPYLFSKLYRQHFGHPPTAEPRAPKG